MGKLTRITAGGTPRVINEAKNYRTSATIVTTTMTENSGYLQNPGIGYQGWTHDIASAIPTNVEYRRGKHPEQGKFNWQECNPSQGAYDWTSIDALLSAAAARGEQASFRIMTMVGESFGGHLVPDWVVSAGATIRANGEPDYRNRYYLTHFGTFVNALRARYDGDARIAFIDISGYGQFNEWQANDLTDDNSTADLVGATGPDAVARKMLIHMFVGGSGTNVNVIETNGSTGTLSYTYTGFQTTQLVMPYGGMWASTRYVLGQYPNVGWRNDALFGPDSTLTALSAIGYGITTRWQTAPVAFEPLGGKATADFPAGTTAAQGLGASLFHDNSVTATAAEMSSFMEHWGYRYACQQAKVPATASGSAGLTIETTWKNTGYAKAYPRMGQDFEVVHALANGAGTVVDSWAATPDVSAWLPNVTQTVTSVRTLPGLAAGAYTVLVGVRNRRTGSRIVLPHTTARSDSWYPAGSITIT